jgi:transcriptional regulator with XRE-family HTH domain
MNSATIKYIRKALNLSQVELGEKVGVSYLTIWRYENDRQKPLPKTLRRLKQALGYTEDDLVSITELLEHEVNSRKHAQLRTKLQQQANI